MLQNIEKQQSCFCQSDGKTPVIELREFAYNETGEVELSTHQIVFSIRGAVSVRTDSVDTDHRLKEGEFIFLPMGVKLTYKASADSAVLLIRLVVNVPECHVFRVNSSSQSLDKRPEGIYALKANNRLGHYIEGLMQALGDGLSCVLFLQTKVSELLFMIHTYYSEEECAHFFSHITTPDMAFSEFVRSNFKKYGTISEMALALGISTGQFAKQFRHVYGTTPRTWIQRKKARLIYMDICQSNKTLKEIAYDYDFTLQSNFTRYCRKTFGKSPGQIRKSLAEGAAAGNRLPRTA